MSFEKESQITIYLLIFFDANIVFLITASELNVSMMVAIFFLTYNDFYLDQRFLCKANIDSVYLEHLVNLKGTILKFFRKIFLKYVSKLDGYLNSINSNGKNVIGSAERFSKKAHCNDVSIVTRIPSLLT